jgi:hypothetical protein
MKDVVLEWLTKAIERHQRHMDGLEPTTGKLGDMSQMLMMDEMKYARKVLITGKDSGQTKDYNELLKKFESS